MAVRRFASWCRTVVVVAILAPLFGASLARGADSALWSATTIAPGVESLVTRRPGLVANAARIAVGAPVELRAVVASGRVGGGHATHDGRLPTSELCARAGGVVCVNGDFFSCPTCGQTAGGIVDRGRPLRSFRHDHEQASFVNGRLTLDAIVWGGNLRGIVDAAAFDLPLVSLNRGPVADAAVLYSADWGPTTPALEGQLEVVLGVGGPLQPGPTAVVPIERRPDAGPIPHDAVVISANGRAADELNRIWDAWHTDRASSVLLHTGLTYPARLSVGGHPILLRDGVRQSLDPADGMVTGQHPRTLLAATAAGEVLLVTIDGRRPGHSIGATLAEATDLLLELGAVHAINLDGGGSTTFAHACGDRACVVNQPSDGDERPVPLALAVVPTPPPPGQPEVGAASAGAPASVEPAAAEAPPTPADPAPSAPGAPPAIRPDPPMAAPVTGGPVEGVLPEATRPDDAPRNASAGGSAANDDVTGAALTATAALAGWIALALALHSLPLRAFPRRRPPP